MQCTKLGFVKSELLNYQSYLLIGVLCCVGPGIGPGMFLMFIADLKALGKDNSLIKFANNCTLLVPAVSDVTVENQK